MKNSLATINKIYSNVASIEPKQPSPCLFSRSHFDTFCRVSDATSKILNEGDNHRLLNLFVLRTLENF